MSVPLLDEKKKRAMDHLKGGRLQQAKDLFGELARSNPADMETWICLVQINAQLGQVPEVERCCREIIAQWPGAIDAHYHLAYALLLQARHAEAADAFRRVVQLNPNHAPAHFHLGKALHLQDIYDEALAHYQQALTLAPGIAEAHAMIGCILQRRGQIPAALACYRRELSLRPRDYRLHSDLISTLNYSTDYDAAAIYAEHRHWNQTHAPVQSAPKHSNLRDPARTLRIGYVSPDLRRHSVAFFIEPLLANHDPAQVETYCYAEVSAPDDVTARLRSLSKHWVSTCGMSEAALAERIRADRIDILVDLAGHNPGHRLLAFAAKPAPLQVTYLGYPNTTGMTTMDYRLTDAVADPPGATEIFHSEKLLRLPQGFLCYRALHDAPAVTALPALTHGGVSFGSFNNFMKVTPQVITLWAAILRAVPSARLIMKNPSFGDIGTRQLCLSSFNAHGIDAARLELLGPVASQAGHMEIYGRVDIALDTFPYNGTTTTCEALWMGIPVITLAGSTHAGRVGASLLAQIGLADLVAQSTDDYIHRAVTLASDIGALARLRGSLRERVAASPLCDEQAFTSAVEAAYRMMWKNWCEGTA